jgi:hypothetical protein
MKALFATLLLLLQLQPALGTLACMGLVRHPAQQECKMPEHGRVPTTNLSEQAPVSSQTCAAAAVCAPAPLAVPGIAGHLESAVLLQTTPRIAGSPTPVDVASAPPFHPPRV